MDVGNSKGTTQNVHVVVKSQEALRRQQPLAHCHQSFVLPQCARTISCVTFVLLPRVLLFKPPRGGLVAKRAKWWRGSSSSVMVGGRTCCSVVTAQLRCRHWGNVADEFNPTPSNIEAERAHNLIHNGRLVRGSTGP